MFSRIDHDDAMVAIVYKVAEPNGTQLLLKICERPNDYLREVYFLQFFADKLPVPRIIQLVEPEANIHGAILMEFLPGTLLKTVDFTDSLAYEMGSLLARIHINRVAGYGDLIHPQALNPDPHIHFTLKFEEGLEECSTHLPKGMLEQCRRYYDTHLNLLDSIDGPCMIHRDFRPGNMIVSDGKIRGVIDWSSGRESFAEDDFCPMEHGEWPSNPSSKKSFLSGYASIRPVPNYSAIMPFLRLNRAIATIGFTVKRGTWASSNARPYQFNRHFLEEFLSNL
jgi:Ser/Thr protein kinase RdoA (MazF antagonist)